MLCLEGVAAEDQEKKNAEIYRRRNWILNNRFRECRNKVSRDRDCPNFRECCATEELRGGAGLGDIGRRRSNHRV